MVLAVSVLVACVFLAVESRKLYFFGDDWEFLLQRGLNWDSLMRPHNEHWSFLPVIAFRLMVKIFGIGHYPAYALMPILLHAACCGLLYLVMRRNEVAAWPAAIVVIPFAFLCGNLGQNPLWDFQIGFLGSAAFGLLSLLSASGDGRTRLVLTWLAMIGSFLSSGMAIPMLVWLGLYVLLRRGLLWAIVTTAPPGVVYLVWYATYGREGRAYVPPTSGEKYIEFVATGLGSLWEQVIRFPGTGGVVLLSLLAVAWLGPLASRERALALSGGLAAVATFLFIGVSRSGLGAAAATVSRYSYFGIAFTVPAAAAVCALAAQRLAAHQIERVVAALLVTIALVGNGVVQSRTWVVDRARLGRGLRGTLAATGQLIAQHATFLNQRPSPADNPNITVDDVAHALADGQLRRQPASRPALLAAAAFLQVASGPKDYSLPAAAGLRSRGLTGKLPRTGCAQLRAGARAHIDLPPTGTGSQILIRSEATTLPAQLLDGALVSPAVYLPSVPGQPTYVATTASQGTLRINFKRGTVSVCLGTG